MSTHPIAELVEARVTPGGQSVIIFKGFPTLRTRKAYQYLIISLRDSEFVEAKFISILRGTSIYKTARQVAQRRGGYPHETIVILQRTAEGYRVWS